MFTGDVLVPETFVLALASAQFYFGRGFLTARQGESATANR